MAGRHQGDSRVLKAVRQCIAVMAAFAFPGAGLCLFLGVCIAQPTQVNTAKGAGPVRDHGKRSFAVHCAACHGLDGRGGEHAPGIVNSPSAQARTDEGLARIIRNGIPDAGMPAFGSLTNLQIVELIRYIQVLRGATRTANLKGDPSVGAKLFFGEARCSDCHMMQGKGGFIGSDLSEFGRTHTDGGIRQIILQPNKVLVPRWQLVRIVTRSGRHFSGLVRNEDNFSIGLLSEDGVFHLLMKSEIATIAREPRSIMPDDYGKRLSSRQLDDLVSYLILGSARKKPASRSAGALTHR